MNKFTVTFSDETQFSGDPLNSDWKKIDDTKQITKLEYVLGNICVIMEGYAQYNHTLECVGLGQKGILKILLMGRTDKESEIIILDMKQKKIYKDFKPCYKEYGNQILDGWMNGLLTTPKSTFKKIKNV